MASVLNKTADPVDYRISVHTPDFDSADWFINPDITAVSSVPSKYWKRPLTDPVLEMTQPEKDAVDAAEAAAETQNNRDVPVAQVDQVSPDGVYSRALIGTLNMRDNYLVNRLLELQAALDAVKASTGPADNIRAAIPSSWLSTATRPRPDAVQAYKDEINAGLHDTP